MEPACAISRDLGTHTERTLVEGDLLPGAKVEYLPGSCCEVSREALGVAGRGLRRGRAGSQQAQRQHEPGEYRQKEGSWRHSRLLACLPLCFRPIDLCGPAAHFNAFDHVSGASSPNLAPADSPAAVVSAFRSRAR